MNLLVCQYPIKLVLSLYKRIGIFKNNNKVYKDYNLFIKIIRRYIVD